MLRIALYVCPQTICSSLSMAQDAFALANRLAAAPCFRLQRFSLDARPVQLEFAQIQVDGGLELAEQADLLIVPATGSAVGLTLESNARLLPWLAHRDRQQVASLCSSAFLLAAAGLLDGRQATTHWALADAFARHYPQVHLRSDLLVGVQTRTREHIRTRASSPAHDHMQSGTAQHAARSAACNAQCSTPQMR